MSCPPALPAGTYIIQAVYNGTTNFLGYTDTSQTSTISAAATATAAASASATFNGGAQNVTLNATITSAAGTVNEGTETFTILNGTTPIGSPVTVNVSAGAASAVYVLPAGTPAGTYIIQAVYNGTTNFLGFTDTSQHLVDQRRGHGHRRRQRLGHLQRGGAERHAQRHHHQRRRHGQRGDRDLHHPQRHDADRHRRSRSTSPPAPPAPVYVLPAGTPAGTYIIQAVYNGTTNFLGFTDTSHT